MILYEGKYQIIKFYIFIKRIYLTDVKVLCENVICEGGAMLVDIISSFWPGLVHSMITANIYVNVAFFCQKHAIL